MQDLHFGGGGYGRGGEDAVAAGKKSRRDMIDEMIQRSKVQKAEKAKLKGVQEQQLDRLDADFGDLMSELTFRKPGNVGKVEGNDDEYDALFSDMHREGSAARATDRTKTEEEIVQEEKERLEELEKARLARMLGEGDEEEGGKRAKGKRRRDDEELSEEEEAKPVLDFESLREHYEKAIKERQEMEDEDDDGEEEWNDDDDDDDDEEAEEESGSGNDEEEDEDGEEEEEEQEEAATEKVRPWHVIKSPVVIPIGDVWLIYVTILSQPAAKKRKGDDGGGAVVVGIESLTGGKVNPDMPYVLECPRSLEQFSDMVKIYAKSVGKRPLLSPSPIVALAWRCSYCCLPSLKTTPPNSDHFDHSIATPFQLESHAPLPSTTIQQISVLQRNNRFILKRKDKTFCTDVILYPARGSATIDSPKGMQRLMLTTEGGK